MGIAMFTGVTGLQAHQQKLDVIAANIANVNTIGYRGGRVLFQDLFSQTLRGAAAPQDNFGGTNPQQVGLGVTVASIDTDFSQGSLLTTGVSSDLAIQGSGFFVLSDNVSTGYTRDGSFTLNADGYLIEPGTGMRVQGYLANDQGEIDTDALPAAIRIPVGGIGISKPTATATFIGNLNPIEDPATPGKVVSRTIEVIDSLGATRQVTVTFTKQTTPTNSWAWEATYDGNVVGGGGAGDLVYFDTDGAYNATLSEPGAALSFTIPAADMNENGAQPDDLTVELDFDDVTQLANSDDLGSDITLQNQDGFPRGVLEQFLISEGGEITGIFSNGLSRAIATVALANFANVGGLMRQGDNLFVETTASGTAQVGPPESGGRGSVSGGVLENSNVDLGSEFSNLIVTQRGFQANARTITAADTLLQETVNLVR